MSKVQPLVVLAIVIAALSLATAQKKAPVDNADDSKKAGVSAKQDLPARAPHVSDTEYVIGPEDVLSVNVWKEPELSAATVPVRPDGKISMPLLHDVQAAGLTPMQLTAQLTEKLKSYVSDPRVAVTVTAVNSRRVYVLGEVGHPGAFQLLPNMTVLQAISAAGGIGQYADQKNIYVLRTQNGRQEKLSFNYKQVVKGLNSQQNIMLEPGDTIVVP